MKKAAFFDVGGTLTYSNSPWSKILDYFGLTEVVKKRATMYSEGKIDLNEWNRLDARLLKGKPYEGIRKALLPPSFHDGVIDAINKLRSLDYSIILVSGGLDVFVDEVARIIQADLAFSNSIGHDNGTIDGQYKIGVDSKAIVLEKVAEDFEYDLSMSIAIGNDLNDISMFEKVGYSLAINPRDKAVENSAYTSISTDNLIHAMDHLLRRMQN